MRNLWIDCLVIKDNEIIEGMILKDGTLLSFKLGLIDHLLYNYHKDNTGWFFNPTKDRYIAERELNTIKVNPQLFWQNGWEIIT